MLCRTWLTVMEKKILLNKMQRSVRFRGTNSIQITTLFWMNQFVLFCFFRWGCIHMLCTQMCTHACLCMCIWRPEINGNHHFLMLLSQLFRRYFSLNLTLAELSILNEWISTIILFLPIHQGWGKKAMPHFLHRFWEFSPRS